MEKHDHVEVEIRGGMMAPVKTEVCTEGGCDAITDAELEEWERDARRTPGGEKNLGQQAAGSRIRRLIAEVRMLRHGLDQARDGS